MFKKIAIALMAVMVFAIPMGASASGTTPNDFKGTHPYVFELSQGTTKYMYMTTKQTRHYIYNDGQVRMSISSYNQDSPYNVGSFGYVLFKSVNGAPYSINLGPSNSESLNNYLGDVPVGSTIQQVKDTLNIKVLTSTDDVFYKTPSSTHVLFMTAPKPPPPPQPVPLQAVKTVEEIIPQTGKVAGGIVLVASILLGLWLVIGLVRRLVFSYLR